LRCVVTPFRRYPHGVPVHFIIRESHLLKHQAAALADAIAAAAATAASANEVACYNLVQFAQSWLEQMQLSDAAAASTAPSVKAAAATAPLSALLPAAAPAADASASLTCASSSGNGNGSVAILLDLWQQGQEIHAQYMVRRLAPHPPATSNAQRPVASNLIVFHPPLNHVIFTSQMELYDLQVTFSSHFPPHLTHLRPSTGRLVRPSSKNAGKSSAAKTMAAKVDSGWLERWL
jgi:hypothetical protein